MIQRVFYLQSFSPARRFKLDVRNDKRESASFHALGGNDRRGQLDGVVCLQTVIEDQALSLSTIFAFISTTSYCWSA